MAAGDHVQARVQGLRVFGEIPELDVTQMGRSKNADGADAQEVAALKLDLELINNRTEEIGSKVDSVEDKVTTLSAQLSRLEELLLADRNQRQDAANEQQQEMEREKAAALEQQQRHTEAQGTATALQRQQQVEADRCRGHSRPPHWRRRADAQDPPRYDYPSTEQGGEHYEQHADEMDHYYEEVHGVGDTQHNQVQYTQYPPQNLPPTHPQVPNTNFLPYPPQNPGFHPQFNPYHPTEPYMYNNSQHHPQPMPNWQQFYTPPPQQTNPYTIPVHHTQPVGGKITRYPKRRERRPAKMFKHGDGPEIVGRVTLMG